MIILMCDEVSVNIDSAGHRTSTCGYEETKIEFLISKKESEVLQKTVGMTIPEVTIKEFRRVRTYSPVRVVSVGYYSSTWDIVEMVGRKCS